MFLAATWMLFGSACSFLFEASANDAGAIDASTADASTADAGADDASPNIVDAGPFTGCYADEIGCPFVDGGGNTWERYDGGCSCYLPTDRFENAPSGYDFCKSLQYGDYRAHMITIGSYEERLFMEDPANLRFGGGMNNELLLGIFYNGATWHWTTDEPVMVNIFPGDFTLPAQPGDENHCIRFRRDLTPQWSLYNCNPSSSSAEIICELDGLFAPVTPPGISTQSRSRYELKGTVTPAATPNSNDVSVEFVGG